MATPDPAAVLHDAAQRDVTLSPFSFLSQPRPNTDCTRDAPFSEILSQVGAPTATSVTPMLTRALDLPNREPWLHDFLFESNGSADIAMLSSPVALSSSCTAHVSDTSMEVSGMYSGELDTAVQVDWALVPAFCANGVTCGSVVLSLRVSGAQTSSCRSKSEKSLGRFIRNESTAEFLLFKTDADDDGGPVCSIMHMTHVNSTTRNRTFIRFRKPPSGVPSAAAILFASSAVEKRMCPSCGKGPSAMCHCSLQFTAPRHPLDFSCDNMESHVGNWIGNSRYFLMSGPLTGRTADMLSRCNVVGGNDKAIIKALAGWAVQDRLAGLGPDKELFLTPELKSGGHTTPDAAVNFSLPDTSRGVGRTIPTPSPLGLIFDAPAANSAEYALDLALGGFSDVTELAAPTSVLEGDPAAPFLSFFQGGLSGSSVSSKSVAGSDQVNAAADVNFGLVGTPVPMAVSAEKEVDKEEADRLARKHRRKLRNREAAARSNKKRKENYENLQKNVYDIRQRKEALMKQLETLRAENEELKSRALTFCPP